MVGTRITNGLTMKTCHQGSDVPSSWTAKFEEHIKVQSEVRIGFVSIPYTYWYSRMWEVYLLQTTASANTCTCKDSMGTLVARVVCFIVQEYAGMIVFIVIEKRVCQ